MGWGFEMLFGLRRVGGAPVGRLFDTLFEILLGGCLEAYLRDCLRLC